MSHKHSSRTHDAALLRALGDDDDSDGETEHATSTHYADPSAPTLFVKRPRFIRTENSTPHTTSSLQTEQQQFDDIGVLLDEPVVRVADFPDYQREDGVPTAPGRGPGRADGGDQYNLAYMNEFRRRMHELSQNPSFVFVNTVKGLLNDNVFEVIDKDAFTRDVEAQVARANEEVRKQLTRAESVESLRKVVADLRKQRDEGAGRLREFDERAHRWDEALRRYKARFAQAALTLRSNNLIDASVSPLVSADDARAVMQNRGLTTSAEWFFDLMARVAYMRYGARGLLQRGFASDIERFFQSFFADLAADERSKLADYRPQVSDVALYLVVARALAESRGVLDRVAARLSFAAKSTYAGNTALFADDVAALTAMIFPAVGKGQVRAPALFDGVSILVYKKLNTMIERSTAPGDVPNVIAKPATQDGARLAKTRGGGGARKILDNQLEVDVDDERLERYANGDPKVFTAAELLKHQTTLYVNTDAAKTRATIVRLLMPLHREGFGELFFTNAASMSADVERLLEESRFPAEARYLVGTPLQAFVDVSERDAASIDRVFRVALSAMALSARGETFERATFGTVLRSPFSEGAQFERLLALNNITADWRRYEVALRDTVARRTVLAPVAELLLASVGSTRLIPPGGGGASTITVTLSDAELAALRDVGKLKASEVNAGVETAALRVWDTAFPPATPPGNALLDGVLSTPSNKAFDAAVRALDGTPFDVPRELAERQRVVEERLEQFDRRLHEALTRTPEDERRDILANLQPYGGVTRGWASQAFNSGLLPLSARFLACLRRATRNVRKYCPNLAGLSDEQLQFDERTLPDFAQLVADRVLLVNAKNPGEYLRDHTIADLKLMIVEDITNLREIDVGNACAVGGGNGYIGQALTRPGAAVAPRREYGGYFR